MTTPSIAIVGAGPAGCYTALALSTAFPRAQLVVIDRLPIPYGLVRYGVAADHQGTKAVTAQFERLFSSGKARFLGGVRIGEHVSLDALLEAFDLVVWAGGLARDRRLGVPGEELPGVHGSGEVSRAWNAHPEQEWRHLRIGPRVAVVGAGNVSLDLVRLLAKQPAQLAGSDLDEVFQTTVPEPVTELTVLVRGEPALVRWDAAMLHELASIEGARVEVDPASLALLAQAASAGHRPSVVLEELRGAGADGTVRLTIRFVFGARPLAVEGESDAERLIVERRGVRQALPVDTVLTAIGFEADPRPEHPRLLHAGWARTGPRGTIPGLRSAARELAAEAAPILQAAIGRAGLARLPAIEARAVTFEDWARIDAHETASAPPDRCRRKLRDLSALPRLIDDKAVTPA